MANAEKNGPNYLRMFTELFMVHRMMNKKIKIKENRLPSENRYKTEKANNEHNTTEIDIYHNNKNKCPEKENNNTFLKE